MATEEPGGHLSKEAEALDGHARNLISDLTDLDVRSSKPKKKRPISTWMIALIGLLIIVTIVFAVFYNPKDPDGAGAAATTTATGSAGADPSGPLAGTWDMYWTNSEGVERKGFTIRFIGAETGTVEILEDATEYGTEFTLDGDTLWFTFTRVFDLDTGEWPETSVFEGTLSGSGEITGEWERQDWSCSPDADPPCSYGPKPLYFPARLVGQP